MAQEIVDTPAKRTDLIVQWGTTQTIHDRKEELAKQQQSAQDKIDILKHEISLDERESKGINLFENGHVTIHDEEASTVVSNDGKTEYLVNKRNGTCKCKDHEFKGKYGVVCQHRIADKLARDAQNVEVDAGVTFATTIDTKDAFY